MKKKLAGVKKIRLHRETLLRLDGHWLILDSLRSELIEDSRVSNFTPLFALDHRGVFLLAASQG